MSQRIDEAGQRMIQERCKKNHVLICLCCAGVRSNLCAAVVVLVVSAMVCLGQVGPKAPPPEKKPPSNNTTPVKAPKKPPRTRPAPKPQESRVDRQPPALVELRKGFVKIPAGEFMMGAQNGEADEKPVHRVRISSGFEMGKYEVTQAQWEAMMESNPSHFKGANLPVENVSWDDVQRFLEKLNARNDGYLYRLPTEAEWEYACRAGTTTAFASGDSLSSEQANFDGNYPYRSAKGKYLQRTAAVGSYQPNAWGLYDMHGNVAEWCQDLYSQNYYGQSPSADPTGPTTGSDRVWRGGGWNEIAQVLRSADRSRYAPDYRTNYLGFRLVRALR